MLTLTLPREPPMQAEYLWRVTKDEAQHTNVDRELIVD
jgi:hypothetical protein